MIKSVLTIAIIAMVILVGWGVLKIRPFTPAGQTVLVGTWKFDESEAQVWQVKNASLGEPFSTSLYVRQQTNVWRQYHLNHQDNYAPSYTLLRTNEIIVVNRGGKTLGSIHLSSGQYERNGGGASLERELMGNPP